MGLFYAYPAKGKACADGPMPVSYNGRSFGEIIKVKDGYQFFAVGSKIGETIHSTLSAVQASLVSMQPSREERKADVVKEAGAEADQSETMIKKIKKELKSTKAKLKGSTVLLAAAYELLEKQTTAEDALNLLDENVMCGETEVDGLSLYEDMRVYLGEP